jgi:carboxypeptidase D
VSAFVDAYDNVFRLNDTFMESVRSRAQTCGFTDLFAKHLTFPPPGPMPVLQGTKDPRYKFTACGRLWTDIFTAVTAVNPCFNFYHIQTTCPLLWDVLGFPGSFEYLPDGAFIYFDLPDVKAAINAPLNTTWEECRQIPLSLTGRSSEDVTLHVLPKVIEQSKRTVVAHGTLDYVLLANGTLLALQNMTWNGARGFQSKPADDFYVPYHWEEALGSVSGAGALGVTATERGLTWVEVFTSGHMIPQYAPSAAFRMLEFLLGRVADLSGREPFSLPEQRDTPQPAPDPNKKKGKGRN